MKYVLLLIATLALLVAAGRLQSPVLGVVAVVLPFVGWRWWIKSRAGRG